MARLRPVLQSWHQDRFLHGTCFFQIGSRWRDPRLTGVSSFCYNSEAQMKDTKTNFWLLHLALFELPFDANFDAAFDLSFPFLSYLRQSVALFRVLNSGSSRAARPRVVVDSTSTWHQMRGTRSSTRSPMARMKQCISSRARSSTTGPRASAAVVASA